MLIVRREWEICERDAQGFPADVALVFVADPEMATFLEEEVVKIKRWRLEEAMQAFVVGPDTILRYSVPRDGRIVQGVWIEVGRVRLTWCWACHGPTDRA